MCGIAGIYNIDGKPIDVALLEKMTNIVAHRGPDDQGFVLVNSSSGEHVRIKNMGGDIKGFYNLGLGHRRLSIIDLSELGSQPMSSSDSMIWITYNGEVYNYLELRKELESKGYRFESNSDTEVILYAYKEWGTSCLRRFNGMFAFAIWDGKNRLLFCARDRFGIKPFFYCHLGPRFLFSSEIKQLLLDKDFQKEPNDEVIYEYLAHDHINFNEETFFKNIKCLKPAHFLVIQNGEVKIDRYWDIDPHKTQNLGEDSEVLDSFLEILTDSVRLRLRSDVPVGSCLSGGLDSSSVVLLANELLKKKLGEGFQQKTFSIIFDGFELDESRYMGSVVKATDVEGNFTTFTGDKLLTILEDIIWHQDEPFGSTSVLAQYYVMKLARENGVKVLLDGQGSDEIFGGYFSYFKHFYADLVKRFRIWGLLKEIGSYKTIYGNYPWATVKNSIIHVVSHLLKDHGIHKGFLSLNSGRNNSSPDWLNRDFSKNFSERLISDEEKCQGFLSQSLYSSLTTNYLPSYLRYEDRNSMAFSIEARLPFLDYRLVEFAFSLPNEFKIREGWTKYVLRKGMENRLPDLIVKRKDKLGFVTPEDKWLRGENKKNIEDVFMSESFRKRGYVNPDNVLKLFKAYCDGNTGVRQIIWKCLNLELWHEVMFN